MKKLLVLLLALAAMLTLASCDEETPEPADGTTAAGAVQTTENALPGTDAPDTDAPAADGTTAAIDIGDITTYEFMSFSDIMNGSKETYQRIMAMSPAERAALIAEGKKEGVDVTFNADGTLTFYNIEDKSTMIFNSDGSWTLKSEEGVEAQFGDDWPDNEYTRLLPKPDFGKLAVLASAEGLVVTVDGATDAQMKAYAEKVKAKGFTIDAQTTDESVMGLSVYTYIAKNAAGYTVTIACAMGNYTISVEK